MSNYLAAEGKVNPGHRNAEIAEVCQLPCLSLMGLTQSAMTTHMIFSGYFGLDWHGTALHLATRGHVHRICFSCNTYGIPAEDRVRIATLRLEGDAAKFQAELTTAGEMPSTLEELYAKLKPRYPVSPEETAPYLLTTTWCTRRYGAVSSGETG